MFCILMSSSVKMLPGNPYVNIFETILFASMQSSSDLQPVSTIFPEVKSKTVQVGFPKRIVIAANFCFSNTAFGSKLLTASKLRDDILLETLHVPTRLWFRV